MKYLWTTMYVTDMEKSVKFYQEVLGLELERRMQAGPDMELSFFKSQDTGTEVELICRKDFQGQAQGVALSLGFAVGGDLDAKRAELEEAGYNPSQIISPNPATRFFFIKDPDGIDIQLVEC